MGTKVCHAQGVTVCGRGHCKVLICWSGVDGVWMYTDTHEMMIDDKRNTHTTQIKDNRRLAVHVRMIREPAAASMHAVLLYMGARTPEACNTFVPRASIRSYTTARREIELGGEDSTSTDQFE